MKIPITIGIIGHRDAVILPAHRRLVKKTFDEIHERYPDSPVVLFSQLAEGVDLEVARLFLEHKEATGRAYRLIVPLPFEKEEFLSDYKEDSLKCFHEVYEKADERFVVPNRGQTERGLLYRQGGQFVSDSSMVLIAFSDKKNNGGVGGTDDLVYYKVHGTFRESVDERLFNLKGFLLHLPCDRGDKRELDEAKLTDALVTDFLGLEDIRETLDKTNEINKFSAKARNISGHTDNWEICTEGEDVWNSESLINWHNLFASHSAGHKWWYNLWIMVLFGIGGLLVAGTQVYDIVDVLTNRNHEEPRTLLGELGGSVVMLIIVMILYLLAMGIKNFTRWKDHTIFIDDRVIAEAIRTQFFWKQSGIQEPVARHILRIHKQEHNWLADILNAIYGLTMGNPTKFCTWPQIRNNWIDDQFKYFMSKKKHYKRIKQRFKAFYLGMIVLGGVSLGALVWWGFLREAGDQAILEVQVKKLGIAGINLAVGLFLIARGLFEKKGLDQMMGQYHMMAQIFGKTRGKIRILGQLDPSEEVDDRIQNLLYLTGKEALIENGNWYLIFKERAPDIIVIPGTA